MKVLLLGAGNQGKATLYDLLKNQNIKKIIVVENNPEQIQEFLKKNPDNRIEIVQADANNKDEILTLFSKVDIIIDLLPTIFRKHIAKLAIEAKTNLVNTSYESHITCLANDAKMNEIIIMPESGLDPGIDLILAGNAIKEFDKVTNFSSACGGVPTKEACNNPLNYKISWIFDGVLSAYKRPADLIINKKTVKIPGNKIFNHSKEIEIAGIGKMDRYPNGKSSTYAKFLGIENVQNMGRYTLRWPGHSKFWKIIVNLGLIDDKTTLGINRKKYFAKVVEPKLKYKEHEQDMVVLLNEIKGIKDNKEKTITQLLIDKKDLETGFTAMNRTVGFTASIIAQMILDRRIKGNGILNPAKDIPYQEFIQELKKREIIIKTNE